MDRKHEVAMGDVARGKGSTVTRLVDAPLPGTGLLVDVEVIDQRVGLTNEDLALARPWVAKCDACPPDRAGEADIGGRQAAGGKSCLGDLVEGQLALRVFEQIDVAAEVLNVDAL